MRAALTRGLLLAPDRISRAAAGRAGKPEEAWLLRQPRAVRRSYVEHVLDRGDDERLAEVWMLRQPKAVRDSYIRDVLTDV